MNTNNSHQTGTAGKCYLNGEVYWILIGIDWHWAMIEESLLINMLKLLKVKSSLNAESEDSYNLLLLECKNILLLYGYSYMAMWL